jgi:hypothetical protein
MSSSPRPHRYATPATLRVAMRAGEALRAGANLRDFCGPVTKLTHPSCAFCELRVLGLDPGSRALV